MLSREMRRKSPYLAFFLTPLIFSSVFTRHAHLSPQRNSCSQNWGHLVPVPLVHERLWPGACGRRLSAGRGEGGSGTGSCSARAWPERRAAAAPVLRGMAPRMPPPGDAASYLSISYYSSHRASHVGFDQVVKFKLPQPPGAAAPFRQAVIHALLLTHLPPSSLHLFS